MDWFLDSGATSHMTNDITVLQNPTSYTVSERVLVGSGEQLPIKIIGTSTLQTDKTFIILPKVLYVSTLHRNLISVGKFKNKNCCSIEFLPWGYKILDLQTQNLLVEGNMYMNLYPIAYTSGFTIQAHVSLKETPTTWHNRL